MSKKYHITENGAKLCSAQEGNCPISVDDDQHFSDFSEAVKKYEERMKERTLISVKQEKSEIIDKNLPKTVVRSRLIPKKGGSYYGVMVNERELKEHLEAWREEIGEQETSIMEQAKIDRDGEYAFHITVFTPKETRQLRKSGINIEQKDFNFVLTGVGSVRDSNKQAWFVTVESQEVEEYRKNLGLGKHNLHITIGFINGDVHNKPKDESSLRII